MPGNKRPRKAYRPRQVLADPMGYAAAGAAMLQRREMQSLDQSGKDALKDITDPSSTRAPADAWATLGDVVNMGIALAGLRICAGPDVDEILASATKALSNIAMRSQTVAGTWTVEPAEAAQLADAVWIHSLQLGACSTSEFIKARRTVANRISQALAGNAGPGMTIVHGAIGQPQTAATAP